MGLRSKSTLRFAGAGILVLFLCWQRVQATRLGYQVETSRKDLLARRGRVAALRVNLEADLGPEQVASRAALLGLVPASPDVLHRLSDRDACGAVGLLGRIWRRSLVPLAAASRG